MTVISDTCVDLGGHADVRAIQIHAPQIRDVDTHILTTQWVSLAIAPDGSFTSPDFQPGPALARVEGRVYEITIPDWPTPIRLGPLLAAALPISPAAEAAVVRNFGGTAGTRAMSYAEYTALPAIDPETLYFIPE